MKPSTRKNLQVVPAVEPPKPKQIKPRREVTHCIRAWRQYRGLTMQQLSAKAGLTASFISQLELGRSSYTQATLEKLADALDCELWQLLGHDPEVPLIEFAMRKQMAWLEDAKEEKRAEVLTLIAGLASAIESTFNRVAAEVKA